MVFYIDEQGVLRRERRNESDTRCDLQERHAVLYIPEGVTEIEARAFSGSIRLQFIALPESLRLIGPGTFSMCTYLREVRLPAGLARIGEQAFFGCARLGSISIPDSVTFIGAGAFAGCTAIGAFRVGSGSRSFTAPDGVIYTKDLTTLVACPGAMASLRIPDGVRAVADEAFTGCTGLMAIELPEGLAAIGREAFCRTDLRKLRIPDSVTEIGSKAFYGCANLTGATLPGGLSGLSGMLFGGCGSLQDIVIPPGAVSIGPKAFANCRSLRRAELPQGLAEIGEGAFSVCLELAEIALPDSLAAIGADAFMGCRSLREIRIPRGVQAIGERAFEGCSQLNAIRVAEGNPAFSSPNGLLCSADGTGLIAAPGGRKRVQVPAGITAIRENAFARTRMQEVTLPEGLVSIGEGAFEKCTQTERITIPAAVEEIGHHAFHGCSRLAEVRFMGGVRAIGNLAFADCRQLRELALPEGTERIGDSAFAECGSLTRVSLPDSLRSIGAKAFSGCGALRELRLPDSLAELGPGAFDRCPALADAKGLVIVQHQLFGIFGKRGTAARIPPDVTCISDAGLTDFDGAFCCRWPASQQELSLSSLGEPVVLNLTAESVFDGSCSELHLPCGDPRLRPEWQQQPDEPGQLLRTCVIAPGPDRPRFGLHFDDTELEIVRCGDLDAEAFPQECLNGFLRLERRGDRRLAPWQDSYVRYVRADRALQEQLLRNLDNLPVMVRLDMIDPEIPDILNRVLSRGTPRQLAAWLGWLHARGKLREKPLRRILSDVRDTEVSALCLEYLRELAPGGEGGAADEGL